MFDHFNVNLRKNEGFLTYIPCIPIPEYGQSNAPLVSRTVSSSVDGIFFARSMRVRMTEYLCWGGDEI